MLSWRTMRLRALLAVGALAVLSVLVSTAPSAVAMTPPPTHASWQWQLSSPLDTSVAAQLYDVDGVDTSAATVAAIHKGGGYAVCYVDVGTWENWRPDRHRFPAKLLGRSNGWPGERWLDIRKRSALAPLLRARFASCRKKGFDAVEPDNVDGYENTTGFPLHARDQLRFDRWIARSVHAAHMAVALKNDLDQARALAPSFDFAVLEQCFAQHACGQAQPFLRAGKGVYDAEYALPTTGFCSDANRLGINAIRKQLALGAWRQTC
jgi:hypothetical protein